jgi:hypothetical protein
VKLLASVYDRVVVSDRAPGPAALAAAARLRGHEPREVTVDLARYAELVEALR